MKFKAPGNEGIMVALTSGHTVFVPPEGIHLEARFRKEAILRGCKPMGVGSDEEPEPEKEKTRDELIEAAIEKMLASDEDDAFTGDGKPEVKSLSAIAGFTVSASERDAAWARMQVEDGDGDE